MSAVNVVEVRDGPGLPFQCGGSGAEDEKNHGATKEQVEENQDKDLGQSFTSFDHSGLILRDLCRAGGIATNSDVQEADKDHYSGEGHH